MSVYDLSAKKATWPPSASLGVFMGLIALALPLMGCGDKKSAGSAGEQQSETQGAPITLKSIVVAQPAALVSVGAYLDFEFSQPLVPPHLAGQTLNRSPFTFEPEIKGQATWLSPVALRFKPDGFLPAGQKVKGVLKGKWALGEHRKVDDFAFEFKVAEQEALELEGEFIPDGETGKVAYAGQIRFAQPVEMAKVAQDLSITGPQGKVRFTLDKGETAERLRVRTEGMNRVATGSNFRFTLPQAYGVGTPWNRDVFLPGKEIFRVVAHEESSDPDEGEAAYVLRFSEELKGNYDLSGFLKIEPALDFRVLVHKKTIKLKGAFIAGQAYTLTLSQGLPSAYGNALASAQNFTLDFKNIEPSAQWISDGVFWPEGNRQKLQFKTMNLKTVRIEVKAIQTGNLGFFLQENATQNPESPSNSGGYEGDDDYGYYGYGYGGFRDVERVGRVVHRMTVNLDAPINRWWKNEIDMAPLVKQIGTGTYIVSIQFGVTDLAGPCVNERDALQSGSLYYADKGYYRNPCESGGYYYAHGNKQKLVIASNIALTLKEAEDETRVYATDVRTAKPQSGLKLTLYSYQNEALAHATTDGDGLAIFPALNALPSLNDSADAPQPLYVHGEAGKNMAVIRVRHPAWEMSQFDVGGSHAGQSGFDALLYADRGVHRPGDTVFLSVLAKQNRRAPPENQPITITLRNPNHQVMLEVQGKLNAHGQAAFQLPTAPNDPTGEWSVTAQIAGRNFQKPLKIETVKPNRLKVEIDLPPSMVMAGKSQRTLTLPVLSKWLFGAPSAGLNFVSRVTISDLPRSFSRYPEYTFRHPLRQFESQTLENDAEELDENGAGESAFELPALSGAPGPIEAKVRVSVQEKGGGFTARSATTVIEPFKAYVGVRNPFPHRSARLGDDLPLQIVALNPKGEAMAGRPITVRVFVNRRYWWWDYGNRDRRDFRTLQGTFLVSETPVTTQAGPTSLKIKLEDEGEHLIEVSDAGGHETGFFVWSSEWGGAALADRKKRDYVDLQLDRNVYHPGDQAALRFASSAGGMALVTLEQGRKVLYSKWVATTDKETKVSLPIDQAMLPNAYAVVSLIQPHGQSKNDLPMRLYGVKPILVEDPGVHLPVTLEMPESIRPDSDFKVTVKSAASEDASFTLAIVDEGLLDLTDFTTPDPARHFLRKLLLGVWTRDTFDEFLGALLPDMDRFFRIGGDEMQRRRAGDDRGRRFKPVSLFQGPIALKAGESKTLTLRMPNYIGSVRAMVVATSKSGFASREATTPVKAPLMVLPTLPRVASPGDRFDMPVSIFRMNASITKAKVTAKVPPPLRLLGPATVEVALGATETDLRFSLEAMSALGTSKVEIMVEAIEGGSHRAKDAIELTVRSPNPYMSIGLDTSLSQGESLTLPVTPVGLPGTGSATLVLSRLPDLQIEKRLRYLLQYPYGCLEQTVSAAFPQLYLPGLLDLTAREKQAATDHINAAIARLPAFALSSGGFSPWPVAEWRRLGEDSYAGLYAGHFLLEAKARGYHVPPALLNGFLNRETAMAKHIDRKRLTLAAYRLFLLSLAERPQIGALNQLRENHQKDLNPLERKLVAAAYILAGQEAEGKAFDGQLITEIPPYRDLEYAYASDLRDLAFLTYLDVKLGRIQDAGQRLARMMPRFQFSGWYSTHETSFALMAVAAYGQKAPLQGGQVKASLQIGGQSAKSVVLERSYLRIPVSDALGKNITLKHTGGGMLYANLLVEGIPIEAKVPDASQGLVLTRGVFTEEGLPIAFSELRQNQDAYVVYQVKNISGKRQTHLALSSLFSSGLEIGNPRMGDPQWPEWLRQRNASSGLSADIRDDRINWFFDIGAGSTLEFAAKVRLSFAGDYVMPPVVVEGMYSPEVQASLASGRLKVE